MYVVDLPLHDGKCPSWLFNRMVKLARIICNRIIEEYSENVLLERLSNPIFLQALGCLLGFDWHSSGLTTVTLAAVKEALKDNDKIAIAGGKGRYALKTPEEIEKICERFSLSNSKSEELKRISRLVARVDSIALQDGYDLYHHCMIITRSGDWAIIQQGMNIDEGVARRYHWYNKREFLNNPHNFILSYRIEKEVLNLASKKSEGARKACLDIIKDRDYLKYISDNSNLNLYNLFDKRRRIVFKFKINWKALERAYNLQPDRFEDLLLIKGMDKNTIRALALIAEIIYNEEIDREDPAKFSFAFGGKDGVPYKIDKKRIDYTIKLLTEYLDKDTLKKLYIKG